MQSVPRGGWEMLKSRGIHPACRSRQGAASRGNLMSWGMGFREKVVSTIKGAAFFFFFATSVENCVEMHECWNHRLKKTEGNF